MVQNIQYTISVLPHIPFSVSGRHITHRPAQRTGMVSPTASQVTADVRTVHAHAGEGRGGEGRGGEGRVSVWCGQCYSLTTVIWLGWEGSLPRHSGMVGVGGVTPTPQWYVGWEGSLPRHGGMWGWRGHSHSTVVWLGWEGSLPRHSGM